MLVAFVLVSFLVPFAVAAVATEVVRRVALRVGLVDKPAARKVHEDVTPLGGGLAIFVAVAVTGSGFWAAAAWLVSAGVPSWAPAGVDELAAGALGRWPELLAIGAAAATLVATGLLDDRFALPWQPRLAVQVLAAAAVAVYGARISVFVDSAWFGVLVTTGWIVTLVNSFNFLDNMNGLSGGLAVIASVTLATVMLCGGGEKHWFVAAGALALAGGVGGFLVHNWRGRIFMGDAGSYFVGLSLGTLTAAATFYSDAFGSRHVIVAPLLILAVPLYD
ncbi:MAG: MraY family glycosyltransferase, partial [Planctomycetota bacterium]